MRLPGPSGFRRLIGLGAILAGLLLLAVSLTASGLARRQVLLDERDRSSELAARATALRVEAYNLFSWQMVATVAAVGADPALVDPNGEAHRHFEETLDTISVALDAMVAATEQPAEVARLEDARAGFEALRELDRQASAKLRSAEPGDRELGLQLITSTEITQYQQATEALAELSDAYQERARAAAAQSDAISQRLQLLLVALTAAMITAFSGLALWVWRGDRRRVAEFDRLEKEANLDPLTALANRRLWDEQLHAAMTRCAATGEPLSVVLIDLDHFKRFNDTYGHPAGDRHLRAVAELLGDTVRRNSDLVARLGGEEFGMLLVGSAVDDASRVVDRVRPLVPAGETLSAGVAEWNGSESAESLISRADLALYEAKAKGRDRFALAG